MTRRDFRSGVEALRSEPRLFVVSCGSAPTGPLRLATGRETFVGASHVDQVAPSPSILVSIVVTLLLLYACSA